VSFCVSFFIIYALFCLMFQYYYYSFIGTYFECMYNLMTFGIPKDFLPFKIETGEVDLRAHRQWIATLKIREAMDATRATTIARLSQQQQPQQSQHGTIITNMMLASSTLFNKEIVAFGPLDIIMGKGRQPKSSVGYLRFRNLLEGHCEEYDNAERKDKMNIAGNILKKLRGMGCRFVRHSPQGLLEECDDDESLKKICHTFRNIRLAKKQKRENAREVGTATGSTTSTSQGIKRCISIQS
jgi:hypothetical protein